MTSTIVQPQVERKAFKPGTTGWTADELDDAQIARYWQTGAYEIIEGVLTIMPAAYFRGGAALSKLLLIVSTQLRDQGIHSLCSTEVDLELTDKRIVRPDLVFVLPGDEPRGDANWQDRRMTFPPTLIVESLSPGHEAHDAELKRAWYAQFGVKNYWLLDGFARSLECLVLENGKYRTEQAGKQNAELRPSIFAGLVIPLDQLWG